MDMKNLNNLYLCNRSGTYEAFYFNDNGHVIDVYKNEKIKLFLLIFNNKINIKVNLLDKGAECLIECVYLTEKNDNSNITLEVVHVSPETYSTQTIKGILTDKSHVIFNGIIRMPHNSQRCVGLLNHRAFVLSDKAQVTATPELEIYADDVQCAHGSAVGPLEKEHLFYLMARGLDEKNARKLLLESAIMDLIPSDYQNIARSWIDKHI